MNAVKKKLAAGKVVTMFNPDFASPRLVEHLAGFGLDGIAVPHVEDAAGARKWVEVVRYARPQDHAEKIVIVMVETPAALALAGEIAAVPGVDVVNIGVNDVAHAAGHPGEPEHPEVAKLVDQAIPRILKARKTVALNVLGNWEERMPYLVSRGVRWLNVRASTFIARGAKQYVQLLRNCEKK